MNLLNGKLASLAFVVTAILVNSAAAQFAPMSSPTCIPTPALDQQQRNPLVHWYPDPVTPPGPYYNYADRTPTAEIRLSVGDWEVGDRSQYELWWRGPATAVTCTDQFIDLKSGFTPTQAGGWGTWIPEQTNQGNGRPDQFDWLIAQLDDRYQRGYRRIVLFMPAGWVICQDFAASQWWPMAGWRRQWFVADNTPANPGYGVKAWIESHPGVEMGIYMGFQIGDPCSICHKSHAALGTCPVEETFKCNGEDVTALWHKCLEEWAWTYPPRTTEQYDLKIMSQNIKPWRDIGIVRFWIDASSGAVSGGETEFREYAWNPNFLDDPPGLPAPAEIGGEAFPITDTVSLPQTRRYTVDFSVDQSEFNYAPYVIALSWAEYHQMNGIGCPPDPNPTIPHEAHSWNLGTYPVREGAIFPTDWPRCGNGSIKPDWDEPWERLKNLYERYICKGFTFWQGDLAGPGSGAAHRFFSFGQIQPGGDFDGDSLLTQADRDRYLEQWNAWNLVTVGGGVRLTYYHGDMDDNGDVDVWDKLIAIGPGPNGTPGLGVIGIQQTPYYLGENWQAPNGSHKMSWNPNAEWLPCPSGPGGNSMMGPSGGPP